MSGDGAAVTHKACIRVAPLYSPERQPPEWCSDGRNLYSRGGLKFFPGRKDVPLLVNHDPDREIGRVHQLVEWDDIGGPWLVARANITDAPEWLKKDTGASFGFKAPNESSFIDGWVYSGYVTEVTVCSPSHKPIEPGAKVVLLERKAPPAAKPKSRPVVAQTETAARKAAPKQQARNLDRELLDWLSSAPDGLSERAYEKVLAVLQADLRGPSIMDVYAEHFGRVAA
jgi:hypothetical protein